MKRTPVLDSTATFLVAALALSLFVGIVRTWVRFQAGILPNQYLAHSALANALLFSIFAAATAVLVAVVSGLGSGRMRTPVFLGAFAFSFFLFWGFNTSIGFRVMREFLDGATEPVYAELVNWLPAMAAFVLAGSALTWRTDWKGALRRSAVAGLAGLLILVGLRIYAHRTDPSVAAPLEIAASAHREPHVFLVLVDTLRADHLGVYGYPKPTSPAVDGLAADSTVYERTFAPAPWTRPSCGALLTSRYPPEIGLDGMFKPLPAGIPILPQYLSNEGYQTAGIVSSVHLSAQFGFDKGWDLLDIGTTYLQWTGTKVALSRLGLVSKGEVYPRYDAQELTDRAIDWLDDALDDRERAPVFMYLHYSDPHAPYRPPEEHDRWEEFARPEVVEAIDEPPFSPTWGGRELSDVEIEALIARYDAEIAYFDQEFQRFLEYLRDAGIYDRSMIIVTSDHGEEFAEHGGWLHAHTLYNELLHVPMIVKYPDHLRLEKGRRVEATASLVDVVPTIRDVLAASWPQSLFRGRSLTSRDSASVERDEYIVYAQADGYDLRAVVGGNDKLIQSLDESGEVGDEHYFSLASDFAEQGPGRLPADFDRERLRTLRTVVHGIDSLTAAVESEEIELDQETIDELRALGYID